MQQVGLIIIGLLFSFTGFAKQACQEILSSDLRHFHSPVEFSEKTKGFYTLHHGQLVFVRDEEGTRKVISPPILNSAAHREILRRQLGAERFSSLMSSADRERALAEILKAEAEKNEGHPAISEDPEELKAEVSRYGRHEPLPTELEARVLKYLRSVQRLASPMTAWLKPKLLGGKLQQLPVDLLEDPIARIARPDRVLYKAQLIEVFLGEKRQILLSAGASGLPDGVHQLVLESLLMIVPRERLRSVTPGYLAISFLNSNDPRFGIIEFLTKGLHKQSLLQENFDFRP